MWLFTFSMIVAAMVLVVMLAAFSLGRGIGFLVTVSIVLFGLAFARGRGFLKKGK